ncbi:MAG: pilus assembly protein CpaE [Hyphomonas sp.]|uniref:AAA family ATPase n=1 Tax=Hyphomonas sp. TaxID=87 RepID=UPI000C643E63|nr:AAA family ATPase [Hyphomonas sp.]MBB38911.1 pilus assembly protein CpaE [Hyphomonas sp.]|tara:strand:- start:8138 stop:9541 length:1404 start_codon:yes stop_codon:yes gene_type:complete
MSSEKPLHESDFESDFEDVFADDPMADLVLPKEDPIADEVDDAHLMVDLETPTREVEFDQPVFSAPEEGLGGDSVLPAISIQVFYERDETRLLMEVCERDRRMGRATIEAHGGGIASAVEYMSANPTPNLLIIESSARTAQLLSEIDQLAEHCDETVKVMVIGAINDISLYRQLVARGVSEYVVPPFQPLQILRTISGLFADPDAPFVGKQISVVGAKGGVGASTFAHNLAWAMAENTKVNTTLVDLDLSFGTTALDFNQEPSQTVADALLQPERADDAVIERLLAKASDRLSLFTAPASISQIMDIPDDSYLSVIEVVRRNVPFLVLDLPHVWSRWVQRTLVASDEVIIVCQPDLASLRNGKNYIDQLKAARPNDNPPRLVINMSGVPKRPEIPVKDFGAAIGVEPEVILPFEPELFGTAANNGQMISETDGASRSAQAIDHMASLLTGRAVADQQKSFIKKLLGK